MLGKVLLSHKTWILCCKLGVFSDTIMWDIFWSINANKTNLSLGLSSRHPVTDTYFVPPIPTVGWYWPTSIYTATINSTVIPVTPTLSYPFSVTSTLTLSYPATVTSTPTVSLQMQQHPTDNQTSLPVSTTIFILSTVIPSTLVLLMLVCTVVVIILIVKRRITRKQVDIAHEYKGTYSFDQCSSLHSFLPKISHSH